MDFTIARLESFHKIKLFKCTNDILTNYLRYQAGRDVKRRLATCFVLVDSGRIVKGFYTLSNAGIPRDIIPDELSKKLPKNYSSLPATLMGRLATDISISGSGYGKALLIDTLKRSYFISKSKIGSLAVIVDPIDDKAIQFYRKFNFIHLPDSKKMFLPMKTISKLIENRL